MAGGERKVGDMARDHNRILCTHAGSLPRPDDLRRMVLARHAGEPGDADRLSKRLAEAVAEVVNRQLDCGIDSINDGELSKTNFTSYVRDRLGGVETRAPRRGDGPQRSINGRDREVFPAYFADGSRARFGPPVVERQTSCVGPLTYTGGQALKTDIANFKAALKDADAIEAFLPSNSPGTVEHWLVNEHYRTQEELVFAIADALHEEYKAITDAGLLLQIDDPDLPDAWQMYPEMDVAEYRKHAELRVDALNHALRDIPTEKIRLHVCWGSPKGPHVSDIPLSEIIDLVFKVRASSYSIEASNPRHEQEYRVFETVGLPEGAVLIPGVIGHYTDWIEHPDLIAERLIRYARLVGRENVMGSSDCGLGMRVPEEIAWAKLSALAEGCRLATDRLWGRYPRTLSEERRAQDRRRAGRRAIDAVS